MPEFLSDPKSLLILCCVGGLVLSFHLTLFGLLRGDKRTHAEASKWTKAFSGGAAGHRHQQTQLAELRSAVSKLEESQSPPKKVDSDER